LETLNNRMAVYIC